MGRVEASRLQPPKGITVQEAARMLRYSPDTVLRMIEAGEIVAWKPRGARGRKWLIDEVSLARVQAAHISRARAAAAPAQRRLIQGELF